MDDALRDAHRRALGDPRDVEGRAAYGQHLLRAGRHAAACHELTVGAQARAWSSARWDKVVAPRPGAPDVRLRPPTSPGPAGADWLVDLVPFDPKEVASPEVPDERWPGARLRVAGATDWTPLVLVPAPACGVPGCADGAVECPACAGRGQVSEFTGRADWLVECSDCEGLGARPCGTCDGTGLDPAPRPAPEGCEHELTPVPEWTGKQGWARAWTLVRCARCGLAALRRAGDDDDVFWACGRCARPRCVCGEPPPQV